MAGGLILIAILAISFFRLPYGCDLVEGPGDEGAYLSSASRYLLGDRPFFDEHYTTPMSFDLFLSAVMRVVPGDSLMTWRIAGWAVTQASILLLFATIWPYFADRTAAWLFFSACSLFAPFNLWTLNYKNLSVALLCMAIASAIKAFERRERAGGHLWLAISALASVFSIVAYLPLAVLAPLPAVYLAASHRDRSQRSGERALCARWLIYLTLIVALAIFAAIMTGASSQILANIAEKRTYPQYATPVWERLRTKFIGHGLWTELFTATVLTGLVLGFARQAKPALRRLGVGIGVTGIVSLFLLFVTGSGGGLQAEFPTLASPLFLLNFSSVLFVCLGSLLWRLWSDPRIWLVVLASSTGLIQVLSASIYSSGLTEWNVSAWLLWSSVGLAASALGLDERTTRWVLRTLGTAFCAFSLVHLWSWSYGDRAPRELQAKITASAKLSGVITSPERRRLLAQVESAISGRCQPGEHILAFGGIPGLAWLASARPLLPTSNLFTGQPPEVLAQRWLSDLPAGRKPCLALLRGNPQEPRAIEEYVMRTMQPAGSVAGYTIWTPR